MDIKKLREIHAHMVALTDLVGGMIAPPQVEHIDIQDHDSYRIIDRHHPSERQFEIRTYEGDNRVATFRYRRHLKRETVRRLLRCARLRENRTPTGGRVWFLGHGEGAVILHRDMHLTDIAGTLGRILDNVG